MKTAVGHRLPSKAEEAAGVDFEVMSAWTHRTAKRIATTNLGARSAFLRAVERQLHNIIIERGLGDAIEWLGLVEARFGLNAIPGVAELIAAIYGDHHRHLVDSAEYGYASILDEAGRQGLTLPKAEFRLREGLLSQVIRTEAQRVAVGPLLDLQRILRREGALAGTQTKDPLAWLAKVIRSGREASSAPVTAADYATVPVVQAIGGGRTQAVEEAGVAPRRIIASELLDEHTCAPCSVIDGHEYPNMAAARRDYPFATYLNCEGGERCRGTLVFLWPTDAHPWTADALSSRPWTPSDEAKHPRHSKGSPHGGEFAPKKFVSVPRVATRHPKGESPTTRMRIEDISGPTLRKMVDRLHAVGAVPADVGTSDDPSTAARQVAGWMAGNIRNVLATATHEQVELYRHWYEVAHNIGSTRKGGTTESGSIAVLALFSAATPWQINVAEHKAFMEAMDHMDEPLTAAEAALANAEAVRLKSQRTFTEGMKPSDLDAEAQALVVFGRKPKLDFFEITPNSDGTWDETEPFAWAPTGGWFLGLDKMTDAVTVYHEPTYEVIQGAVGDTAKVPSFYNNIMDPHSEYDDVTADTHSYGIALGQRVSSSHPFITTKQQKDADGNPLPSKNIFSNPSSATDGTRGCALFVIEAHRIVAAETGLEPREVQSVTWELWRQGSEGSTGQKTTAKMKERRKHG